MLQLTHYMMFAMKEDEQLNSNLSNDALLDISFQIISKIIWTPTKYPAILEDLFCIIKNCFYLRSICIDAPYALMLHCSALMHRCMIHVTVLELFLTCNVLHILVFTISILKIRYG